MMEDKKPAINGRDEQTFLAHYNHNDIKSVSEIGLDWAALVDLHDYYRDSMLGPLEIIAESGKPIAIDNRLYLVDSKPKRINHGSIFQSDGTTARFF